MACWWGGCGFGRPSLRGLLLAILYVTLVVVAINPVRQLLSVTFARTDFAVACELLSDSMNDAKYPKIIHQTWKDKEMPARWRKSAEKCKELNPGYEYMLWTDDDIIEYIKTFHSWFLPTFKSYPYNISKVDAIRYFMLRDYGGVYIDLDIECVVPFDDIIAKWSPTNKTHALLLETNPIGFTNSFMVAKKGHPFFKALVDGLPNANRNYWSAHWTIMRSAGPCYVHQEYSEFPCKDTVASIPVAEGNRMYHHEQASTWHSWDGKLIRLIDVYHKTFIALGVAVVSLFLFTIRGSILSLLLCVVSGLRAVFKTQKAVSGHVAESVC